jgi:hypothetical protein
MPDCTHFGQVLDIRHTRKVAKNASTWEAGGAGVRREGSPLKVICAPQAIRHAREFFSHRSLRLVPRRWTHGDELERGAFRPGSVVVHLIWDIVDDAARPHGHSVVLIELWPRAD